MNVPEVKFQRTICGVRSTDLVKMIRRKVWWYEAIYERVEEGVVVCFGLLGRMTKRVRSGGNNGKGETRKEVEGRSEKCYEG